MNRLLVIGHTGVVGGAIRRRALQRGLQVAGVARSAMPPDVSMDVLYDDGAPLGPLLESGFDAVILAAALSNVDGCEIDPARSRKANVEAPARIAELCARGSIPLVFYSTDYVFDGTAGPCNEEAAIHPINVYGRHKVEAEQAIRRILPGRHLILRTHGVFGLEAARKNFVLRLIDSSREGTAVKVPADQMGTPTWSDDLADATLDLLEGRRDGTVHVAGTQCLTRDRFARLVAEIFQLDTSRIEPVATAALGQPAPRPLRGGLESRTLHRWIGREMLSAEEGLRRFASQLAQDADNEAG